jgi:dolichol-phosphate mannosyltransferase
MKVSICVPVYNEEPNIKIFYEAMIGFLNKNNYTDYEIIFSNNRSTDNSEVEILKLCQIDKKVKYISFVYNLGYDRSVYENYLSSSGDIVVSIDCDLQDDLETINQFIKYWKQGHDMVYGIRYNRKGNYLFVLLTRLYYRIFNFYHFGKIPNDSGDFRLIDKKIVKDLRKNNTISPYIRFLTFIYASNPKGVFYNRQIRKLGSSKFGYWNSFKYAIKMLTLYTNFFPRFFGVVFLNFIAIFLLLPHFGFLITVKLVYYFAIIFISIILLATFYLLENVFLIYNENRLKNHIILQKINFNDK